MKRPMKPGIFELIRNSKHVGKDVVVRIMDPETRNAQLKSFVQGRVKSCSELGLMISSNGEDKIVMYSDIAHVMQVGSS